MKNIKKNTLLALCLLLSLPSFASDKQGIRYTDARELTQIGKGIPGGEFYHRVDTLKYNNMPPRVKYLYTNSAGLGVVFKTNSKVIKANWEVVKEKNADNMTPIVNRGLDLYIKRDGVWQFAAVGRPVVNGTKSSYTLIENMEEGEKECLLYFPLYDELKDLQIGVSEESYLEAIPSPFKKKIAVYGSSITQGASASRPGMAYPSILSRKMGLEFINLGVSGSGKMEPEVADMLADIDADAFILDCTPNSSHQNIKDRAGNLVETIRKRHPNAPIIMIESGFRETGNFNPEIRKFVETQNILINEEYQKLIAKGVKDLYMIPGKGLYGTDHEGTTDGLHPTDLGFLRFLEIVEPVVTKVLKKAKIY